MISSITIDKVFQAADLLELAHSLTQMKKTGANYVGLSPFKEEETPSFTVSPSKGIWKCFATGEGGTTAVDLLMKANGLSYPEAIKELANRYGIKIEYDKNIPKEVLEKNKETEELQKIMEGSMLLYHKEFKKLPDDHPAVTAWTSRGFEREDANAYKIGYAPGNFLYPILAERGKVSQAKQLGLIDEKRNFDKLNDRLIFPITKNGKIVGYGGRRLDDTSKYPKWVNSRESDVYNKETVLFGFDQARNEISNQDTLFLVEGYTDAIALQLAGIKNVASVSGTSLSNYQLVMIKRACKRVVLAFDSDTAGHEATLRALEQLIKAEMVTEVLPLPFNSNDPNDYILEYNRRLKEKIDVTYTLADIQKSHKPRLDGYEFLVKDLLKGKDDYDIAHTVKRHLESVINRIKDSVLHNNYIDKLSKISNINKSTLNKWIEDEIEVAEDEMYSLPARFKKDIDKYRPTIEKYMLFMAGNQIYIQRGKKAPYYFTAVSNFEIEIIQHMQDDEFPRKLIRVKNIHKYERIFDIASSEINYPQTFETAITNHGNFRWTGSKADLDLLKTYLFDQMGTGRMIEVLGWQPEGFWVWNNRVTVPGEDPIELDSSGMFVYKDRTYYVPSANITYKHVVTKYSPQKRFIYQKSPYTFLNFTSKFYQVHRGHAITGILFSIASAFQDIVEKKLDSFPMIFLYGPPSSGKDQLANTCQTFYGVRQTAQNLEGGANSMVAQLRKYAQFCNAIHQLSEYKPGDERLDGRLKGLWDRDGYERGTVTSMTSTHNVPILCSTIMTGNFAPEQEALITRLIWETMDKSVFTDEESKAYDEFSDMSRHGASSFIDEALHLRPVVEQSFLDVQREFEKTLKERVDGVVSRIAMNLSVLGAFYQIFQNVFTFPFSHDEMMKHFTSLMKRQMSRLRSSSLTVRFWECFLASMRGQPSDQIRLGHDFKLEGEHLYFNITSCYLRIQRQWYIQYRQPAPSRAAITTALKDCDSFVEDRKSVRMAPGRDARNTSACVVDLQFIDLRGELHNAIAFQASANSIFPENPLPELFDGDKEPPATPKNKKASSDGDLPF